MCENWNSHGTTVGGSLCQLGAVLSLETGAVGPLINTEFQQVIPLRNALMGQKHGHCESVYVEYMVSVTEQMVASGEDCNYFNHATFQQNRHDAKVQEIFDEKVPGYYVQPQTNEGHIFDFKLSCRGARLIDDECKDTAMSADEDILVFHSASNLSLPIC